VSASKVIGPFFFDGKINSTNYRNMLSEFFVDELTLQVLRNAVFQQDGAPAHFSRPVREFLDETFPGRWIGCGGSVEWPPYSPDLTPCDFWLWGMLKDQVYSAPLRTIEELKERITVVIQNIPASM
jgi:hypothetical protein